MEARIVVCFRSEEGTQKICDLLSAASLSVRSCCRSGGEVIRQIRSMDGGIVICSPRMTDMTADDLYQELDGMVNMLIVGKPEMLDHCENTRIFRLPLPVNRYDLSASVSMLIQLDEMQNASFRLTQEDRTVIDTAKRLLCTERGMTEPEAHHFLQKQSMNRHMRMASYARRIIDTYEKGD